MCGLDWLLVDDVEGGLAWDNGAREIDDFDEWYTECCVDVGPADDEADEDHVGSVADNKHAHGDENDDVHTGTDVDAADVVNKHTGVDANDEKWSPDGVVLFLKHLMHLLLLQTLLSPGLGTSSFARNASSLSS